MRGIRPGWDTKKLSLKFPPSPREAYWIGTFSDSEEPEFTGYHPGVILSGAKTLREAVEFVSFIPLTSDEPKKSAAGKFAPYVHQLSKNPNPFDDRPVWAICNHVMTVRLSRLERYYGPDGLTVPKVSQADFDGICDAITNGMVVLRNRMDNKRDAELVKLKGDHEKAIFALKADFEAQVEMRAFELLDEMTKPEEKIA